MIVVKSDVRHRAAVGSFALVVASVAMIFGGSASAQAPAPATARPLSPSAQLAASATPELRAATEAMGMLRGVGPQESMQDLNTVEFVASGRVSGSGAAAGPLRAVSRYTAAYDYFLGASRIDVQFSDPGSAPGRLIEVVRADQAWNEAEPGIAPSDATTSAAERLTNLWTTPHGALRAAVENPTGVSVEKRAGVTFIIVAANAAKGVPSMSIQLDADNHIASVTSKIARADGSEAAIVVTYSQYKDFDLYGVFFPEKIVKTLDGVVTEDLSVTQFLSNPYVIFPPRALLQ